MEYLSDEQLIGLYLKKLQLDKKDKDFKKMLKMELMKRDLLFEALDRCDNKNGKQVGTDA
ncbi:hypothetical protein [Bacillus sp. EB600]|uniref:hypothetical protein n=1 Tax=Bacillus sp. EB600 TaxID=2806345 RepID=UPI00210F1DDF|nr:hypothetical protein [Bacillus sp. EB600]MCQ6282803.1 hypothetical protein [Bacillus sp. EB600]